MTQMFSDYIVYVDESGDHGLDSINANYPIFSLAFCVFQKNTYTSQVVPDLQEFKFNYWGHDSVILHEHDIRKSMGGDYAILNNAQTRTAFINDLNSLIENSPFEVLAAVIRKDKLSGYSQPSNPYELAMLFCMERLLAWLCERGEEGKSVHVIFESRGKREDAELELEFRRICDNASGSIHSATDFNKIHFTMRFMDKKANASGLQLADLVARPIGLSVLRPQQENRAFDIIKQKFIRHKNGSYDGKGLKIFPK